LWNLPKYALVKSENGLMMSLWSDLISLMVENVGMIGTFSNMCYVTFDWYT
jgi:hypothetical protein